MFKNDINPVAYNGKQIHLKCGEIFFSDEKDFLLVCSLCEMKYFDFKDFVFHIKNIHLDEQSRALKAQAESSKSQQSVAIKLEEAQLQHDGNEDDNDDDSNDNNTISSGVDNQLRITQIKANSEMDDWHSYTIQSVADDVDVDDDDTKHSYDYDSMDKEQDDLVNQHRLLRKPRQLKEFNCRYCNKNYTTEKYLNIHIKLAHLQPKPYKCDMCEIGFTSERALNSHHDKVHVGFACNTCDKVFKTKQQLCRHSDSHNDERKYVCPIENCGKTFRTQHCLQSHKRLHTRERNFVCEICGYRSYYKDGLIVHRRSHTGEKPFQCKLCERKFASKPLLVEHQAMHATDRPFKCEICDASFSRPKALYHHKHLHLDVKKFVCKICGNAYAQAAGLSAHMRNHRLRLSNAGSSLELLQLQQEQQNVI